MNTVQHTEEETELIEVLRIRGSEAKPLTISNVEPKNTQLLMKRIRFSTIKIEPSERIYISTTFSPFGLDVPYVAPCPRLLALSQTLCLMSVRSLNRMCMIQYFEN